MGGYVSMRCTATLVLVLAVGAAAQPGPGPSPSPSSGNRVNKHTYSSNDGRGDYDFISTYFCDADTSSAPFKCAVDMKASCSGFDVHMVQSYVTANGTETPDEWFSYMKSLHGEMATWDQSMHYGTTFMADDLTEHLARFQKDKVAFMARKTSSGLYSLLVQTPSAKTMEIVSSKAPSSGASLFTEWNDPECPAAHERDLSQLPALKGTHEVRASGLPSLTAIGVNLAATEETVNGVGAWLTRYGISGSKATVTQGNNCSFASITYSNAEVRYVSNPGARIGDKSVEE